jgi:hypothetical protein
MRRRRRPSACSYSSKLLPALVKSGREPKTMRWIVRALLTQNLEARLPDDESLRGIPIRRFRARPTDRRASPNA